MLKKLIRGKDGLIVDFDHAKRSWTATHDASVRLARYCFDRAGQASAAAEAFPNATGNYFGKRIIRPEGKPLSPDDRFARLRALYLSRHTTLRNPPRGSEAARLRGHAPLAHSAVPTYQATVTA